MNFCRKLYKKVRKKYYNTLKLSKATDDKTIWKTIKPFFFDKAVNIHKITFVDNKKVVSDDEQLCKTFSNFLQETVKALDVSYNFNIPSYSHSDPVNDTTKK